MGCSTTSLNSFLKQWILHCKIRISHLMQVCYASHSSSWCSEDKNTHSRCEWLRQTCYYSAHLTDGNAISESVFMIRIYDKPLMTYLYFVAFYMTVTPLLASARKPPRYLWSFAALVLLLFVSRQLHMIVACEYIYQVKHQKWAHGESFDVWLYWYTDNINAA